jgi:hypothetical protein
MSVRVFLLAVILAAATVCFAQKNAQPAPAPQSGTATATPDAGGANRALLDRLAQEPLDAQIIRQGDANICFTMRSYYFERHDGSAPRLVGTSTCTKGNPQGTKRVGNGGAKLVPLAVSDK